MIQITNDDLQYLYNCIYPCGENAIKFVVNNDLRGDTSQIGLTITQNSLHFIKEDADEVRSLINSGYDYNVNINNMVVMQLDFANYEDDGLFVNVPLISSSLKDFLQNTTLETLGVSKVFDAHFLKKPRTSIILRFDGATPEMQPYNESSLSGCTPQVVSGVIAESETLTMSGEVFPIDYLSGINPGYFLRKWIPVGLTDITTGTYKKTIKGTIKLIGSGSAVRKINVHFTDYVLRYENGDRSDPRLASSYLGGYATFTMAEGTSQNFTITNNSVPCIVQKTATYPTTDYSMNFGVYIEVEDSLPHTNVSVQMQFDYEIEGVFENIDYTLQSITMNNIRQALTNRGLNVSALPASNYFFITSPNVDKLNNTKLIDIVAFFSKMQGKILIFSNSDCASYPFDYIFGLPIVVASKRCNIIKKGIPLDYSYKIGTNPSKLRLANVPQGMWSNTYSTTQKSKLLEQKTISAPDIVSDGAEILNILISNDKQTFIIDNSNNNIESDDDTPINYNFSACMVAKNNIVRVISNSQNGVTSYTPDDTTGVTYTIPDSGGLTTAQTITYPSSQNRLSPYTEEFDIPMTSSMINYILNWGFFIRLRVDGQDFCVESCEFGIEPSQVHITARKVM